MTIFILFPGPQITLYLPKELLKQGTNKLTIIELQKAPRKYIMQFSDTAKLDDLKIKN